MVGFSRQIPRLFHGAAGSPLPSCPLSHREARDLAHLVLDPAASVRTLVHGALMRLEQEGRSISGGGKPLCLANPGETLVVLE